MSLLGGTSPALPTPTYRRPPGELRRFAFGVLVGWVVGALLGFAAIACWPGLVSGLRSRFYEAETTVGVGRGSFSFLNERWRDRELCDISFERQQVGATHGVIVVCPHPCCGVMDFGDVPLSSVREAPPSSLFDLKSGKPVEVVKGHTYCVAGCWPHGRNERARFHYAKFTVVDTGEHEVRIRYVVAPESERTFPDASGQVRSREQRPWETALMNVRAMHNQLDWRLKCAVPAVRQLLMGQVSDTNTTIASAPSAAVRDELEDELREFARSLVALDVQERECLSTLDALDAVERKLALVGMTEEVLGSSHEELLQEVQRLSQRAGAQLKRTQVPAGAASDGDESATEEKLRQLRQTGKPPGIE